jgi:ElaB/YqjD/DUF883 family membrane-anchored ribosome-binding protein
MSTSLFNSPHTEALKKDVRNLAQDATLVAQRHVVEPATAALRDAVSSASDTAKEVMGNARSFVNKQAAHAEQAANEQWDRASNWVSANPFSAIGIAFGAGLVFSAISTFAGSRR